MLFHDSHDAAYRFPLGPVSAGGSVTIRFYSDEASRVSLRTWDGAEHIYPMEHGDHFLYSVTIDVPGTPMLFWYDFLVYVGDRVIRYGTSYDQLGGEGAVYEQAMQSYQITVYDPAFSTPSYMRHGVIYQIFPDRFCQDAPLCQRQAEKIRKVHPEATFHQKWNEAPTLDIDPVTQDNRALDFFGGTLKGITQKLDWLKDLGITVLYLNPIFQSRTNHRYDTGDYGSVDPILGDLEDFQALISSAKARGMEVMLDGVFSHTGSDSKYFNRFGHYDSLGAYQSTDSPYYSWYTFFKHPDRYNTWWGFDTLPTVNKDHPAYRHYLLNEENGILPFWVKQGACGWRLDVADELPVSMLAEMRKSIKAVSPDSLLLGEVWEDASNKVSYGQPRSYCLGDTLDSVMNYPLRRGIIDFFTGSISSAQLRRIILHQQEVYPAPFYYSLMNLLGSHDRVRIVNAMAGYDREGIIQMDREEASRVHLDADTLAAAQAKVLEAYKLLCALPGAPTIYYGDEIGMQGMADPWNRAPMAWEEANLSLRDEVKALVHNRHAQALLQTGFLSVAAPDDDTLVITRFSVDGKDAFGSPVTAKPITVTIRR